MRAPDHHTYEVREPVRTRPPHSTPRPLTTGLCASPLARIHARGTMARRIQAISRHLQQQQLFQPDEGRKMRLHSFKAGPHLVSN